MKKFYIILCGVFFSLIACSHDSGDSGKATAAADSANVVKDPLPSWNDPLKGDIMAYVTKVSKEGGPDFIPVKDRIATIDNDGTLWAEMPLVQELFAYYQVKKILDAKPGLAKKQPFLAVVTKDKAYFEKGGDKALIQLVAATHTGMTEDQFEADTKDFFATAISRQKCTPSAKLYINRNWS